MPSPSRFVFHILSGLILGAAQLYGQSVAFTTLAGSTAGTNDGANSAAQFDFPGGIAVDNQGNLFVGDTSNNTIRKVTPVGDDWIVTTIAGLPAMGAIGATNDGVNGEARFYRPDGVVADGHGNLFVVDHNNDAIRQLTLNGTDWIATTIAGWGGIKGYADGTNSDARFFGPTGITIDSAGNLYVGDTATFTVRKIAHLGTNWVTTTIAGLGLNFGFVDGTNGDARFSSPYGLTVDPNTNIYVADFGNHAIRKIHPSGTNWVVTTIAGNGNIGSANGTNLQAEFNFPADIARDTQGNLYVSDLSNNTIRKITPIGTNWVTSTIGGVALVQGANNGLGTNAHFYKPWGLAMNAQNHLFIVDHSNQTIRQGVPMSSAAPTLRITRTSTQVLLSWPLAASAFVPEGSTTLSVGALWTPVRSAIVIAGNNFWQTNNVNGNQVFYRLRNTAP